MKNKIYLLIFAVVISFSLQAQKPLTLQQCVDTALANNRNVKQQALNKQSKAIAYQQARNNLLPDLNASASQDWNFGRSLDINNAYKNTNSSKSTFGFSSSLTLFDGLKMKYNIDARKADMLASDADLLKIQQDIIVSVSTAFLQILMNKELLQIANEQLVLTKAKIEQRKTLVESGKLAEGEIYELVAQEYKEEQNRIQAQNSLKLSLLDLAQILELENFENLDIQIPENLLDVELQLLSAESVYESAISHRPEIKGAEYRLKNNETNVLISKSDYYPTLRLQAQSGTGYYNLNGVNNETFKNQLGQNFTNIVGLNLQIPIFNKFEIKNRVKTAQIGVESSKLEINNTKLELKKSIQQAYYNAIAAKARWDAAQKSEVASREAYRFANQKYDAGRANSYELYQAKNNLTQVLSEQTQAKYEYVFRIKLLELMK